MRAKLGAQPQSSKCKVLANAPLFRRFAIIPMPPEFLLTHSALSS